MPFVMQCGVCGNAQFSTLIKKSNGILCQHCGAFTYSEDELGEEMQDIVARLRIGYQALHGYHFSDAKDCFQHICHDHPNCAEAYWGSMLAEYGITYVRGFYDGHIAPIYCFREYNPENVTYCTEHPNFLKVMELFVDDAERKMIYRKKAEEIDGALDIFADHENEKDIDLFICVKISQASVSHPHNHEKTELDFPKAMQIMERLQNMGKRVFFSYESLENNPDSDMEIWTNLLKSKKMLLIASKKDYLESVWVKSEWQRWLYLDADGEHKKNLYLYLIGDASRLSKRLPEGLAGRQFYTEEREDRLLEDICGGKTLQEKKTENLEDQVAQLQAQIRALQEKAQAEAEAKAKAETKIKIEAEVKEKAEAEAKTEIKVETKPIATDAAKAKIKTEEKTKSSEKDGKVVYTDGTTEVIPYGITEIAEKAYSKNENIKEVVLPESVTSIGNFAFYLCTNLTSITIPKSVTLIGESSFAGCRNLKNIRIPYTLTNIGGGAFNYCEGLTDIYVEQWNPVYHSKDNCLIKTEDKVLLRGCVNSKIPNDGSVTAIGAFAFLSCKGLKTITIPDGVVNIGSDAFWSCDELTEVTIPKSVTDIGADAFKGCKHLTVHVPMGSYAETYAKENQISFVTIHTEKAGKIVYTDGRTEELPYGITEIAEKAYSKNENIKEVVLPNSVTSIGECAFLDCSSLMSITIPNSVTSIGENAFSWCSGLTSITIPNSVTSIGEGAFYGCSGLTSIEIPRSVTIIALYAFQYCSNLTSITIPNSVTSIGGFAFSNCEGLTSIEIPRSVTVIEESAFSGCSNLTSIYVDKGNPVYHSINHCLIETKEKTLVCGCRSSIIPSDGSVTSIEDYAFRDCSGLMSITIPSSVTSIGEWAFYGCSGLMSITIPSSVTSIGESAFEDCTGLTSIEIPNSVTSIGNDAFRGCKSLTSIEIPNSVTSIDWGAFQYCNNLTSITIPNSLTSIGSWAFSGCSGLTSIKIPNSVTRIGDHAFSSCKGLTSITIPDSVTSIDLWAFEDCSGLMSITIPSSVTSIGEGAFYGCSGLMSITIPSSVTSIGESAFEDCTGLTSIEIPNSVTSIEEDAFSGCEKLTIFAPKGSYAEKYAKKNNIPFQPVPKKKKGLFGLW